jgi:hypothetical protein
MGAGIATSAHCASIWKSLASRAILSNSWRPAPRRSRRIAGLPDCFRYLARRWLFSGEASKPALGGCSPAANLHFPASSVCTSETLWRGIQQSTRFALLPVSVLLCTSAFLPDKLKVSPSAESGNGILMTYPQYGSFAVDKRAHKKAPSVGWESCFNCAKLSHKRIRPPRSA